MSDFAEFQAGALTLRPKMIPTRKQFHVVRRLAPFIGQMGEIRPLLSNLQGANLATLTDDDQAALLRAAGILGRAIAEMPDEAADYVLDAALAAAEVQQSDGGWAALRKSGVTMFSLDLAGEMIVTIHVLRANLAGFIAALSALGPAAGRSNRPAGG